MGKVLIHHTILKTQSTPAPPFWDVVNDRSIGNYKNTLACESIQFFLAPVSEATTAGFKINTDETYDFDQGSLILDF